MKFAAAPIWIAAYASPALPLVASWMELRALREKPKRFVKLTLISSSVSFLWLYSGCFTQALLGPAYGSLREVILLGNFFGILLIGAVCFWAKPNIQWFTAIACALTAFFWLLTIAANSVA